MFYGDCETVMKRIRMYVFLPTEYYKLTIV